jgi:hypothetical protein
MVGAVAAADRALALAIELAHKDPTVATWNGYLLGAARLVEIRIAAQKAPTPVELRAALLPAVAESERLLAFARSKPPDLQLARVSADALVLAGSYRLLAGQPDLARAAWSKAAAICLCHSLDNRLPAAAGAPDVARLTSVRDLDLATLERDSKRGLLRQGMADIKHRWLPTDLW